MYPANPREAASRQAGLPDGRERRDRDLPPARRALEPRRAAVPRARACAPGDGIAICLENHPRFYEIAWAAQRAGLYYTRDQLRGSRAAEVEYIVQRLRREGASSRRRRWRATSRTPLATASRRARDALMVGGTSAGYRVVGGRRRAAARDADRRRDRGHGPALLLGHDRAAEGRQAPRCPASRSARRPRSSRSSTRLYGVDARHASTSRPRRSTTPRRCAST